jgi:hypothetical protein
MRFLRTTTAVTLIFLVLLGAISHFWVRYQYASARAALQILRDFPPGASFPADVDARAAKVLTKTCSASVCLFRADFSNLPFSLIGYAKTNFRVVVGVENSQVKETAAVIGRISLLLPS